MTLRRRRPRPCEHHAIHGTRCLDCHATVTVPAWFHAKTITDVIIEAASGS